MTNATILWADDEIDLLRPHILYLEEKGYDVIPVTSGRDALDELEERTVDMVFLDEQMPGLSGIDTLKTIKERWPQLPVVMITKSEEEHIMEDALGGKISDYLIKPVGPSQLLLTVKKHTERRRLQTEHSTHGYQQQFREIGMQLSDCRTAEEWMEMYRRLVYWDLELAGVDDENIHDIFLSQRSDANAQYCRFYEEHYLDWIAGREEKPLMSHTVLKERLMPMLQMASPIPTFLIVIDNFRYDQWRFVQPLVEHLYRVERDEMYYTILPTTTQFARNAMFAGLMPSEIERKYPQYWVNEDEQGYKNQYEDQLLEENLRRHGLNIKHTYNKVLNAQYGRRLVDRVSELMHSPLNVIIYNFVDMLSHSTTDSDVVRQLADSDSAYRSLTLSWMQHSPLMEMLQALAERDVRVIITTDHGSTRVEHAVRVRGDRDISVNLRYKQGRLLDYNPREVFEVKDPAHLFLPRRHINSPYIFARANDFFAYPNNYNQYVQLYTSTLQHGGISLEETLVPFVTLQPKRN
ncbi:MAG: PglZ domain-containing protein [Bacteroidales bacterium]|nr:PglZ domain-containing protein [Bacteroidales bacterium]